MQQEERPSGLKDPLIQTLTPNAKGNNMLKGHGIKKFVRVQLCNSLRYKIYLSNSLTGMFQYPSLSVMVSDSALYTNSLQKKMLQT